MTLYTYINRQAGTPIKTKTNDKYEPVSCFGSEKVGNFLAIPIRFQMIRGMRLGMITDRIRPITLLLVINASQHEVFVRITSSK